MHQNNMKQDKEIEVSMLQVSEKFWPASVITL